MHKTVNKVVKVASSALHAVVASEGADIVEAVIGDDYTVGTGSGSAWSALGALWGWGGGVVRQLEARYGVKGA